MGRGDGKRGARSAFRLAPACPSTRRAFIPPCLYSLELLSFIPTHLSPAPLSPLYMLIPLPEVSLLLPPPPCSLVFLDAWTIRFPLQAPQQLCLPTTLPSLFIVVMSWSLPLVWTVWGQRLWPRLPWLHCPMPSFHSNQLLSLSPWPPERLKHYELKSFTLPGGLLSSSGVRQHPEMPQMTWRSRLPLGTSLRFLLFSSWFPPMECEWGKVSSRASRNTNFLAIRKSSPKGPFVQHIINTHHDPGN